MARLTQSNDMRQRLVIGASVVALILLYLAVGLYPFRWDPLVVRGNTAEVAGQRGLEFVGPGPGIGHTIEAPDWIDAVVRSNRLEIDLRVRPYEADQWGPARIMTLSLDKYHRNFTVGHEGREIHKARLLAQGLREGLREPRRKRHQRGEAVGVAQGQVVGDDTALAEAQDHESTDLAILDYTRRLPHPGGIQLQRQNREPDRWRVRFRA